MRRKKQTRPDRWAKRVVTAVGIAVLLPALLLGAVSPRATQEIAFPLETTAYRISDEYGMRQDPFTGEKCFHAGVDLACAQGTVVLAAEDGIVIAARNGTGYGNHLRICHAEDTVTVYAHLQYLYVRAGEIVHKGQPLGTVGQTGRATGAHLHFELYRGGERCDPAAALGLWDEA